MGGEGREQRSEGCAQAAASGHSQVVVKHHGAGAGAQGCREHWEP